MAEGYKAILTGKHLEWLESPPSNVDPTKPVTIYVTLPNEPISPAKRAAQGQNMAEALEKLAALNALPDIVDPVEWQRETRQDRTLHGRDT
jgi:hypothetical protein